MRKKEKNEGQELLDRLTIRMEAKVHKASTQENVSEVFRQFLDYVGVKDSYTGDNCCYGGIRKKPPFLIKRI